MHKFHIVACFAGLFAVQSFAQPRDLFAEFEAEATQSSEAVVSSSSAIVSSSSVKESSSSVVSSSSVAPLSSSEVVSSSSDPAAPADSSTPAVADTTAPAVADTTAPADTTVADSAAVDSAKQMTPEEVASHLAKGKKVTFYTCCSPQRPNTFTDSAPAESAYLGWFAAATGYSGYLRWAYNSWVKDPCVDSRFRTWRAGDCYLVYPDGSSIRMERLIEGIQDYEKIRILRESLDTKKTALLEAQLLKFQQIDWDTVSDSEVSKLVNDSKALIRSFEK